VSRVREAAADLLYGAIQLDAPARHLLTRAHADYLAGELDRAGLLIPDEVDKELCRGLCDTEGRPHRHEDWDG